MSLPAPSWESVFNYLAPMEERPYYYTSPENAQGRESIEVRTLAFF